MYVYMYIHYFHCMYARRITFCTRSRNRWNQPGNPALVRKSGTSPQVWNQSGTSLEKPPCAPRISANKKTNQSKVVQVILKNGSVE